MEDATIVNLLPVCECEYGVWVTTRNRDYRFDDVLMLDK